MQVMEKTPFEAERSLTNENLGSERKKTDAALGREVESIEQIADVALQVSRAQLDADLQSDRAESDRSRAKAPKFLRRSRRSADASTSVSARRETKPMQRFAKSALGARQAMK